MSLLLRLVRWLLGLVAAPAAAREAGRLEIQTEAAQDTLTRTAEVKDAQADIASRPGDSPAAVLERMRSGQL
ncbi:hypothetical protein [Niveispirillum cyanobacteriorum]|uniref:Uncharacterized protein n=1 Tax=Niveispirillum cyanobacteriorum TaxID=1612173 RepID=A0A2K9NDP3_9PROT|nr:hypothetical protein [Niveispirillum cyanobacteriorum]AUN31253.1 hypothetical protein C0V82_14175 [Niveispirillum cyanobacteriorum]GGE72902.1 hypothetical protein GCM10011317_32680 [Niveispirillum cyanobacteriorum]